MTTFPFDFKWTAYLSISGAGAVLTVAEELTRLLACKPAYYTQTAEMVVTTA